MQTREEITAGLTARFAEVAAWFDHCPDTTFVNGPEGRWTAGQHLDHLIRSTKPLNMALRLPKLALRMKFGTAKAPGEALDALAARYESTLASGGKASGQFVPPEVALAAKPSLVENFRTEGTRLTQVVGKWKGSDLDQYLLPHPLLGNLTVREMLFFTYHHMGHHLDTLTRDY